MKYFDLVVEYDIDLGAIYLADFKAESDALFLGKHSMDYLVLFRDGSGEKPYFKKSNLARMRKDELCDLAFSMGLMSGYSHNYRKDDVIEILMMDVTNRAFYEWHFENENWHDLDHDFLIRGYGQGEVIAVKEVGEGIAGKEYLQHLFFDSPVFARLQILEVEGGEYWHQAKRDVVDEIDLTEYLYDVYSYDKDHLLVSFAECYQGEMKDAIIEYLKANLPDEPSY